jgi:hypothetical protein
MSLSGRCHREHAEPDVEPTFGRSFRAMSYSFAVPPQVDAMGRSRQDGESIPFRSRSREKRESIRSCGGTRRARLAPRPRRRSPRRVSLVPATPNSIRDRRDAVTRRTRNDEPSPGRDFCEFTSSLSRAVSEYSSVTIVRFEGFHP